jgi:uncharacterized membrane protein
MTKANGQNGKTAAVEAETPKVRTTPLNRLALWITTRVGSMGFFLLVFAWTAGWLLWNMFAPRSVRFDPYPGFVLWLFISNMIQLFLMPLVMIGQNLQGRSVEERAKNDYKVNLKAEKEIKEIQVQLATILKRLDELKGVNEVKV